MKFSQPVHLAVIGDGFIRTPFLTGTNDLAPYRHTECVPTKPQIVHIPAAGRRSGLSEPFPAFRRAYFASTLVQSLSTDEAAQTNQEGAGLTFRFSEHPHRNICQAHIGDLTNVRGEPALILDAPQHPDSPMDFNTLSNLVAPSGWLVWITRYWNSLRHVDQAINKAVIPLHFDLDLNTIYSFGASLVQATVPIHGGNGPVKVYEPALGISSAEDAIILTGGGYYLNLAQIPAGPSVLKIALTDGVEVYSRDIVISDEFPTRPVVGLPTGMVGSYYAANIPPGSATFEVVDSSLPLGVSIDAVTGLITGYPEGYGTNYYVLANVTEPTGAVSQMRFILTIAIPARELMTLVDEESNDHSTGEYYSLMFVPYGCCIEFGGEAFHFLRIKSSGEPWPFMKRVPYSYLTPDRATAREMENVWTSE